MGVDGGQEATAELYAAMRRLQERKEAIGVPEGTSAYVEQDATRRIWSGLDIDYAEAVALRPVIEGGASQALSMGAEPEEVARSLFFDGVATGLLIAETRAKRGKS